MAGILLYNAEIIDDSRRFNGYIGIENERISDVGEGAPSDTLLARYQEKRDLNGCYVMPGVIDDQVHFRDPGLTHKADIETESRAAAAGGVTSFMDMPNTVPQTVTVEAHAAKMQRAAEVSRVNYSFFIGATNDNFSELERADFSKIPGIKVFLGASTGNMLVDREEALDRIFSLPVLVAIHSEDESMIRRNAALYKERYGEGSVPVNCHPLIRSSEACVVSTRKAVERAHRLGTRLHLLHISTKDELDFLQNAPLESKRITSEVCVHHLWFTDEDYARLGTRIKWNPSVKSRIDRDSLRDAVNDGVIDIVATDHAPHLLKEKQGDALTAASGGPMIQHSLQVMLELARQGVFRMEKVPEMMANRPARLFGIEDRGFLRKGYYADIVIIDPDRPYTVQPDNILTKCGWSPLEGFTFSHSIVSTYVNGSLVWNGEQVNDSIRGMSLDFRR